MLPRTMAFTITDEEDYSTAVALLGVSFLCMPMDRVLGNFVVINEVGIVTGVRNEKTIALSNTHYVPEEFFQNYRPGGEDVVEDDGTFFLVERL